MKKTEAFKGSTRNGGVVHPPGDPQIETDRGSQTTRYTTDAVRACQGRIRKLLQEVGGIEDIQIKVDDARTLAEYFSGIRHLPEFENNTEKAAGLFKAMQAIFNFSVVVKTLATYYYSKDKRGRTSS